MLWFIFLCIIGVIVAVAYIVVNEKVERVQWLAAGDSSGSDMKWSMDGKNWNDSTGVPSNFAVGRDVVFNGNFAVAVGGYETDTNENVLYSEDGGKSWNVSTGDKFKYLSKSVDVGEDSNGNTLYVAGGKDSAVSDGVVLYSSNGKEWTKINVSALAGPEVWSVYYDSKLKRWFFGCTNKILYSDNPTDLSNFTEQTGTAIPAVYSFTSINYDGTVYIFALPWASGAPSNNWRSTDGGVTWIDQGNVFDSYGSALAVGEKNTSGVPLLVAGGETSGEVDKSLRYSEDLGGTWNDTTGSNLTHVYGLAYHKKKKLWVATGDGTVPVNFVWSKDGKTWNSSDITGGFSSYGYAVTSRFS